MTDDTQLICAVCERPIVDITRDTFQVDRGDCIDVEKEIGANGEESVIAVLRYRHEPRQVREEEADSDAP